MSKRRQQTFFDVQIASGRFRGLKCNHTPLRKPEADRLAASKQSPFEAVEVVPTSDQRWEDTYGDK